MFKRYEELAEFHEANVEAAMRGTRAVGRGADDLRAALVALAQRSSRVTLGAAFAFPRCRSVNDLLWWQSALTKTLLELCTSQSRRMAQISTQSARAAMEPVEQRVVAGVHLLARAHGQ